MTESENTPNSHHPRGIFDHVLGYVFFPTEWFFVWVFRKLWGSGTEAWRWPLRICFVFGVDRSSSSQPCWLREREVFRAGMLGPRGWVLGMRICGPLHAEVLLTLLTHVHPSFCWEEGTELIPAHESRAAQVQMRNLKKWCQSLILLWDTPLFALIFNNAQCFSNFIVLQNYLGPCQHSSLDSSPRESDSGGWGGAWELAFPPSCQMVAVLVVWGPPFENHCPSCPLRLAEKLVRPRRCSLLVRWLLSTSCCIESCRQLAPIKCGKCTANWPDGDQRSMTVTSHWRAAEALPVSPGF